ncbi:MAG: YfcE family phosphodiesterase [Candidatus Hermodarchaeota archaeon]
MVRILCIGDAHIPNRAQDLPNQIYNKINQLTETDPFDYTFFTGDIVNFPILIEFLNQKTRNVLFKVMGNMDYFYGINDVPVYQKLDFTFLDTQKITIGLIHGHQITPRGDLRQLELLAIDNSYNILISGHTHKEEVFLTDKGILLLNPGSVTGAWSFFASGIPSFIILNLSENRKEINIKLLQLKTNIETMKETIYYYIFKENALHKK